MLSSVKTYLANQARKPSGWFGRIIAPLVYNWENAEMENFGLELMDPDEDDRILEIGFGNGRLISEMIPILKDGKVCGIDISREMVEVASKQNAKWTNNGKLELKKASIEDIPYPDNYFDKAFTCNTIYFWPEPKKNLQEIKRVLQSNGKFVCVFRDKELMKSKSSAVRENRGIFQNLYQAEEVKKLFKEEGFLNVKIYTQTQKSENFHVVTGQVRS